MTRSITATWPVQVAVDTALFADAMVTTLTTRRPDGTDDPKGPRIYAGEGDRERPGDSIVYGTVTESERALCGEPGAAGLFEMHLWAGSHKAVQMLWQAVHGALADATLTATLADGTTATLSLELSLLNVLRDPDTTTTLYHAPVAVRWWAIGEA